MRVVGFNRSSSGFSYFKTAAMSVSRYKANSVVLSAVVQLLSENDLPVADLTQSNMRNFLGLFRDESVVGIVGVDYLGESSLLRSMVVDEAHRGLGLGVQLVGLAEQRARSLHVKTLYLLTNTAEQFFLSQGYRLIDRSLAPAEISSTPEFSSLCPSDASLLCKSLYGVNGNHER